jgi:hypothetical protein
MQMMNLHAQFMMAENSADFRLLVSAVDEQGTNVATIESFDVDDPNLGEKLRLIAHSYRMGARFG